MRRMLLALAAALLLTFAGAPAHAHDDLGDWEVITTETGPAVGGEGIEVRVEARLTYAGDGHPATGTPSASITAEGPAGLAVGPALATETTVPGVFTATLVLPERGAWTLRLNALEPLAVLEVPIEVSALVEPPADGDHRARWHRSA